MNFKIIKPGSPNKLRDTDIAISVASGIKLTMCAVNFNLCTSRIGQIVSVYRRHILNIINNPECYLDELSRGEEFAYLVGKKSEKLYKQYKHFLVGQLEDYK